MSVQLPNTIPAFKAHLESGALSAGEAVELQVRRFADLDQQTRAVVRALAPPPHAPDQSLPLGGVCLAHKDIFNLPGHRPGLGRDRGAESVGMVQAPCLSLLEQAGAINLGTLAMAEDACSATGQTQKLPTPLNPLGADMAVGGSSSGSAVAVASGMVYASLGTDTAGSVRIPAMTCGVMGLKTTHELIPRDGMSPLCPSLDSVGILARSTADLTAVLQVMAPNLAWETADMDSEIRVGFWLDGADLDQEVRQVIAPVMRRYGQQHLDLSGHERCLTSLQELVMAYEVAQTHASRIARGLACPQVQSLGAYGLTIPASWWRAALRERPDRLAQFVDHAFASADVLLAPLQTGFLPTTREVYLGDDAFKSAKLLGLHRYCGWINYLGLPALSMPVGTGAHGMPVSIQLVGKPFSEPKLLALGRQIATDIHGEHGIWPVLRLEG
ncbi:amidase [Orrella daihaiensis]|uniref:Amidase n=1 Tax=Orrella daihaiensis TaxID=2782176 RepID=A0ABY4APU6_9BURK|nr:amidase [Orrella daihaiensis]UOD51085.1 amidase [Orrella daihaiensis]